MDIDSNELLFGLCYSEFGTMINIENHGRFHMVVRSHRFISVYDLIGD